jgi:arabinofuranosyltransferase
VLVTIGLSWLGLREWYFSRWMDDDAFISFRYARNLVRGYGLVFNPGERVEGYSNFLWTLFLALFHRCGLDLPGTAQILGCLFSYLTVLLLLKYGAEVLPPAAKPGRSTALPLGILAPVLTCFSEPWAAWAVGGLENTFGAFLATFAFLLHFRALRSAESASRLAIASGTLCALAALTHPSFALFGAVLGSHLLLRVATGRTPWRVLLAFAAPILVIVVPYGAWKLAYYGSLLPNTFRAKVGFRFAVLLRGLGYYREMVAAYPIPALILVGLPVLLVTRRIRSEVPWVLMAAVYAYGAYGLVIGGEVFPAFRLVVVVLPLVFLLVQYAVAVVAAGARMPASERAAGLAPALAVLFAVAIPQYVSPRVRRIDHEIARDSFGLIRAAALALKDRLPPGILFAHSGAGMVPYYTEFRFLDTLGLTDAHIAARRIENLGEGNAGHEKGDGRYVFERRPDVVMFSGDPVSSFEPALLGDRELFAIPQFHTQYQGVMFQFRFFPRSQAEESIVSVPLYVRKDLLHR